jgi:hypothetical protein
MVVVTTLLPFRNTYVMLFGRIRIYLGSPQDQKPKFIVLAFSPTDRVVGLERGPLSLVNTIEELTE